MRSSALGGLLASVALMGLVLDALTGSILPPVARPLPRVAAPSVVPPPPPLPPPPPPPPPTPSIGSLWQLGDLGDSNGAIAAPAAFVAHGDGQSLAVASSFAPLHIVPRSPEFVNRARPAALPAAPNGSLHMERLPPEAPATAVKTCLTTRDPTLRTAAFTNWTLEATALLLDTSRFGHSWQTIIGRNGVRHGTRPNEADLPTFALKLAPSRRFVLLAWMQAIGGGANGTGGAARPGPRFISIESEHVAQSNVWYHLVVTFEGQVDGAVMQLSVNGVPEARVKVLRPAWSAAVALAPPTRPSDGDWTFGCGMHKGVTADTCSCLLSEARMVDRALDERELLWYPTGRRASYVAPERAAGFARRR